MRNLVSQIKTQAGNLANEGIETALTSALEKIEGHLAKPDETLLRKALGELHSVLTKAAGGLVSTGALALLHQILGTGVFRTMLVGPFTFAVGALIATIVGTILREIHV